MSDRETPDFIASYLKLVDNTEPPISYHVWTSISLVAAALQRKCKLKWGSLTDYPNMYIVLVGPPGRCRKGTAMKIGRRFIDGLGFAIAANCPTREALIQTLNESANSHVNTAGLQVIHSSLTIYSEELVVFLGHQNYQLMGDLTDWFDCADKWEYRTKNMGTDTVIGVWVNLLGATTPDLIQTALPLNAIGGGLTSRMIFVFEPNKGKNVPYPEWTERELRLEKQLMNDLSRINNLRGTFKTTPGFIKRYTEWYVNLDKNNTLVDPRFAGYCERRATHLRKLCMISSASRSDSMVIDVCDFDRIKHILETTEIRMPQAFSGVGKNKHADTLVKFWQELGLRGKMKLTEIYNLYYMDADIKTINDLVRTLVEMNLARVETVGEDRIVTWVGQATTSMDQILKSSACEVKT